MPSASYLGPGSLAPTGSTGNNTHGVYWASPGAQVCGFQFVVEAVGATPTVTFKFQGTFDGTNWYDLAYITDATDTSAVTTRTVTAVGASCAFLANPVARRYKGFRCVTTANTNVTYRAELWGVDPD